MEATRTFTVPTTYHLGRSLAYLRHGVNDPTTVLAGDGFWRATNTPDGPATVHVPTAPRPTIDVTAFGPGAAWVLDRADDLIGLGDDPSPFEPERHPRVAEMARRSPSIRLVRTHRAVEALVPTIISQKVDTVEAKASYRSLIRRFGTDAPGPAGLRLPPTPERLAELGYADLHASGIERRRAEALLRVARSAGRIERAATGSASRFATAVRQIPGIGSWTEGTVRLRVLGDPDAVPVGDFHFPSVVAWNLAGERRADDERMLELLAPFDGQRGRALRLIVAAGEKPPRRAPRRRIRNISRY